MAADTQSTDLSGIANMQIPDMADLNANVDSAVTGVRRAESDLSASIADEPPAPDVQQFTEPEPQRNIGTLMQMSPWLIALSALGGSRTKLSANNLMAAQTGMIQGMTEGDDQRYQEAYQKWQTHYKEFADIQKQKWDVYREMVKVYKDQIDGKQRALQAAEAAVRDARTQRHQSMTDYMQVVRAGQSLRVQNARIEDIESQIQARNKKSADEDASELTPEGMDLAAQGWLKTGQMPTGLGRGATGDKQRMKIINRAAEIAKAQGDTAAESVAKRAAFKAGQSALSQLEKSKTMTDVNEKTANKQLDMLDAQSKKVSRTKWPIVNEALLSGKTRVEGDEEATKLLNLVTTTTTEYAKVMTGQTGGAAVSDAARRESASLINAAMNQKTISSIVAQMRKEMQNKASSYTDEESEIHSMMTGGGGSSGSPYTEGQTATGPNGQKMVFKDGSWQPLK